MRPRAAMPQEVATLRAAVATGDAALAAARLRGSGLACRLGALQAGMRRQEDLGGGASPQP